MKHLMHNNKVRKASISRSELGMSLVEVLVALSLFAMVSVTFSNAMGTNYKVLIMADQRTIAESLAKTQLEAINNTPYNSTSPYTYNKISDIPAGYDINIAVALVNPETGATSALDLGVQKITVTVTCQWHSPTTVLTVASYKR